MMLDETLKKKTNIGSKNGPFFMFNTKALTHQRLHSCFSRCTWRNSNPLHICKLNIFSSPTETISVEVEKTLSFISFNMELAFSNSPQMHLIVQKLSCDSNTDSCIHKPAQPVIFFPAFRFIAHMLGPPANGCIQPQLMVHSP